MNEHHPTLEQLVDYLHGELAPPQDAAVHTHLAQCSRCAASHDAEASLTDLIRAHANSEERELPQGVVASVRESVSGARRAGVWDEIRAAFRPVVVIPAAAALVAALYLGAHAWRATLRATPINAAYYVNNHAALTATAPFSEEAPLPAMLTSDDIAADQQALDAPR